MAWSIINTSGMVCDGESDVLFTPDGPPTGRRGVLLLHGAGGAAGYVNNPEVPGAAGLFHHLADQGFTMLSSDWGGPSTWGNDTAVARLERGRQVLVEQGCAADKVALVGVSMGGLNALNYAVAHPGRVAAIVAIVPAADLEDIRALGPVANRNVTTALGIGEHDRIPPRSRAILNAETLKTVGPVRLYYSTADRTTRPGPIEALGEAIRQPAIVISTTLDHSDDQVAAVPKDEVAALLHEVGC